MDGTAAHWKHRSGRGSLPAACWWRWLVFPMRAPPRPLYSGYHEPPIKTPTRWPKESLWAAVLSFVVKLFQLRLPGRLCQRPSRRAVLRSLSSSSSRAVDVICNAEDDRRGGDRRGLEDSLRMADPWWENRGEHIHYRGIDDDICLRHSCDTTFGSANVVDSLCG